MEFGAESRYDRMEINNYDSIADLYDIYVPATFDIDFFINETKKTSGEVMELMSGSGRVSIPLIEAGVKLTCVDISTKLNAIFKEKLEQKGLHADIYQMDVCELDIPKKFAMVIIPFHSFAHIISPDEQRKALSRIHQHLLPGGTFICTLRNPTVRRLDIDGQLSLVDAYPLAEKQGKLLWWMLEEFDPDDDQVVNAYEIFEEYDTEGSMIAKRLMELHFRLTTKDEFEQLLKDAGFLIMALYGDYAYHEFDPHSSPSLVWVLQKTGQALVSGRLACEYGFSDVDGTQPVRCY
jgi:SAM-dependent methyltransferase